MGIQSKPDVTCVNTIWLKSNVLFDEMWSNRAAQIAVTRRTILFVILSLNELMNHQLDSMENRG